MPSPKVLWKLEGGYSRFLEGSHLDVVLEKGPLKQELGLSPVGLFRGTEPLEVILNVTKGFNAKGPGNLRWHLRPHGRLRALILQAGNAYLGNFRVPEDHFAVQWDVQGETTSSLGKSGGISLLQVEAGTRLIHSWVEVFGSDRSLLSALHHSWKNYRNPFDAEEVLSLRQGQVIRWRWSGQARASFELRWGIGRGWQINASKTLLEFYSAIKSQASFKAKLKVSKRGSFVLRVAKRKKQLRLSITQEKWRAREGSLSARATLRDSVKLRSSSGIGESLLAPLNDKLAEAVARRAEIAFLVESERQRSRRILLSAVWKGDAKRTVIVNEIQGLLKGNLPLPRQNLRVEGHFETVRSSRLKVELNLLNWIRIGRSTERRRIHSIQLGPTGEVLVEEGEVLQKTRYRWDELQFLRLLYQRGSARGTAVREFIWTFGRKERFALNDLTTLLNTALQVETISEFGLPAAESFPLRLNLTWLTRFSEEGIQAVRHMPAEEKWKALIRSLELVEPASYGKDTFRRDWIVSEAVRHLIDQDPVQSHLASKYPISGRTVAERRQVVAAYRKRKKFLRLATLWNENDPSRALDVFEAGMEVPVFIWFHLLCPRECRDSFLMLTGDVTRVWGNEGLAKTALPQDTASRSARPE